jgi:hypothetical protein
MTLRLYHVKNATPTDLPNQFQLELEGIDDVRVVVDNHWGLERAVKRDHKIKLAILKPFQARAHESEGITRLVEDSEGRDRVEHAAVLLEQDMEGSRTYYKVDTGGVVWVPPPKHWNQPQQLYISTFQLR